MDEHASGESGLDEAELRDLFERQDGVVSRRQVLELGGQDFDIARMLRRKEIVVVHPGVYVNHTGTLSWEQRAWAAVLALWPAALTRESALPKSTRTGPIHVAIKHGRTVKRLEGVVTHRTVDLDARVQWVKSPPWVAIENAVIDVAVAKQDVLERFRVLADACQTRQTTAAAIRETLVHRKRVAGKQLLLDLLDDLARGACSVLEREYLRLERAHGLPEANRQQAEDLESGRVYRDAPYREFGVFVELDGRAFHDSAADRDQDFERDLDTAVSSEGLTVRLTYGQVYRNGCRTLRRIATLLERRGWPGPFIDCPACP
jgi:hypothetical protein